MLWIKKKRDKKHTLVFKTQKGIKRSRPQNISSERADFDCTEEQITGNSQSERPNSGRERING